MDKKIFYVKNHKYIAVCTGRNYIEYYVSYRNTTLKRKRWYKGLNHITDLDELVKEGHRIAALIQFVPKAKAAPPLSELHKYLMDNQFRLKPRTFTQFIGHVNRFTEWCYQNNIKPHKAVYRDAVAYVNYMNATRTSNTMYNVVLVLKSIFKQLHRAGIATENPFDDLPKFKRNATSLMHFNTPQQNTIKTYCKSKNIQLYRAIALLYSCAIRPNEMRHLKLYNFNFEDNTITIEPGEAKNSKLQKVVMPAHIAQLFLPFEKLPGHYYIFTKEGMPGDKLLGENFLNNQHKVALKECRIVGHYALYSWKHTGVIAMVRAGINIKMIQLQCRHSSLDMTAEYLKNLGVTDQDELLQKLPIF
jgi:integrase